MIKLMARLFLSLTIFVAQQSWALLDLELTQGVAAALPVAVLPFSGEQVTVSGDQSLTGVISNDLQHSGEFRVVNPNDQTQATKELDLAKWRSKGADYVVTGSIFKTTGQNYEIRMQLHSAFNQKNSDAAQRALLLDETFSATLPAMRAVAHRISDDIYYKLTGIRGVFSTKIAYILVQNRKQGNEYQLEVADADGFGAQTLLRSNEPIMSPTWSYDGKNLFYVSFEGHHAAIYSQALATGKREVISDFPGINGAPVLSPNGKQMAMVLSKNGNPNIYLLDLDTKKLQPITSGWAIDTEPAFSADGSSLIFTSSRHGSPQIYHFSMLTGVVSRLTYDGNYNARASYTPDGQMIVMMHRDENGFGIATLDLSTGRINTLTQGGNDESPSVAPNGKMVIYATEYGGRGVLAQVSIDGRIKLRLPAPEGAVREPAWSGFAAS